MKYTSIIIPFVGGLGMFIYGMQIMAQGLENAAGNRMKSLLEALTKNKFFRRIAWSVHYRSDPELICDDRHGSRFCKCRYHEPSAGDGSYHGCEHRYNSYRMAGIQCGMGQIFKSVQSGTGCDHDRCDHYADRKEAFDKRYRKYCGWFRTFICRDFIHVLSGGTTER